MSKFSFHHNWNEAWLLVINWLYQLPHELLNELRLRILGNLEVSRRKPPNFIELLCSVQSSSRNENFVSTSKNWNIWNNWNNWNIEKLSISHSALFYLSLSQIFVNDCRFDRTIFAPIFTIFTIWYSVYLHPVPLLIRKSTLF